MLTVADIAEKLKVDPNTIYRWKRAKKIPFVKLPGGDIRFSEKKIEEWLEKRSISVNKKIA
jgi:excisionase family DNA binding protein